MIHFVNRIIHVCTCFTLAMSGTPILQKKLETWRDGGKPLKISTIYRHYGWLLLDVIPDMVWLLTL